MTPDEIAENIQRRNWDLVAQPGQVGADAVPVLLPLLEDRDSQVRELTIAALDLAGGPAAAQGLLQALDDPVETTSAAAVRALGRHYTPVQIPAMRDRLVGHPSAYVRAELALIFGRTGDAADLPVLAGQQQADRDEHVRHAVSLALARLGDALARSALLADLLESDKVGRRVRALLDLPYVNDPALLPAAAPLLDDLRPGLNIGPSHGPYFMRVCDVAVLIASRMIESLFPFETGRRRYTDEELELAKEAWPK